MNQWSKEKWNDWWGSCENIKQFSSDFIWWSLTFWSKWHIAENMDHLPDKNSSYKDVAYWDERYTREQQYDWLGDLSKFQHLLEKVMKKEDSILILGS